MREESQDLLIIGRSGRAKRSVNRQWRKTGGNADPSLRWHDPDQVQRVRLTPSQPHGTPLGLAPVIRHSLFDYNAVNLLRVGDTVTLRHCDKWPLCIILARWRLASCRAQNGPILFGRARRQPPPGKYYLWINGNRPSWRHCLLNVRSSQPNARREHRLWHPGTRSFPAKQRRDDR